TPDEALLCVERVGVGQIGVIVDTEEHAVLARKSRESPRDLEPLRADTTARAQQLRAVEHRVDLGVGMALVYIHVVAVNRNPSVVEFLFDGAIVFQRTTESPA